jgi:hypothetical protein
MSDSWRPDGSVVPPQPWHEDLQQTAVRVFTFGLVPVILGPVGLVLLFRGKAKVQAWLGPLRIDVPAAARNLLASPRDMAGLFAVVAGVTGFFFLPHGELTELFGRIKPTHDPVAALQMVVAMTTMLVVLVVAIRRLPRAGVLTQLFQLNLALLLIAAIYRLYGGIVGASEAAVDAPLGERAQWHAIAEAVFLVMALLWDLFASGKEIARDGPVFPRQARVLLYAGYIMLVCTAVLFVSSQTIAHSSEKPERFFEAEEVVRQGVVWLGSPLLLLSFLLQGGKHSVLQAKILRLGVYVANRVRNWFSR